MAIDNSKASVAAMTMVNNDAFFLGRWLAYWRQYLPDKHIYIVNHSGSQMVKDMGQGCNILNLPYDESKKAVTQRRWNMLSHHTSALTNYYHWVAVNDVDELIVLDPEVSGDLVGYLMDISAREQVPPAITTFAIEMVHVPELEPLPLEEGEPIIGRRRIYRLNSNYAKPCLISVPTLFKSGGHGGSHKDIYIDPHLYNFHLRFIDYDYCMGRFQMSKKRRLGGKTKEEQAKMQSGWGWETVDKLFEAISKRHPVAETIDHPDFRRQMIEDKTFRRPFTLMGGGRPRPQYTLPERFNGIF